MVTMLKVGGVIAILLFVDFSSVSCDVQLADPCPGLVCGKNAIKALDAATLSHCLCACPSNFYGDAQVECKEQKCGTIVGLTRWIIGGRKQSVHSPWMASIGYWDGNYNWKHQCGGSLITNRHVITAAHCTTTLNKSELRLRFGIMNLTGTNEDEIESKVKKIYLHPKFDLKPNSAYHDVAVLQLDEPIKFTDNIRPICLPEVALSHVNTSQLTVAGWGRQHHTSEHPTDILKQTQLTIYSNEFCNASYSYGEDPSLKVKIGTMIPDGFTNQIFCAGIPGESDSACHGDSGGPALSFISSTQPHFVLTGIVQGGAACGDEYLPGIFTNIVDKSVLDFVKLKSGLNKDEIWDYTPCSRTCGGGKQARFRKFPSVCRATVAETINCNTNPCPAFTNLLVAEGRESHHDDDEPFLTVVEIIDLKSSSTTCDSLPSLPYSEQGFGAIAYLGQENNPVVCGGTKYSQNFTLNECFSYQNSHWLAFPSMLSRRMFAAISAFPHNNITIKFLVTGGVGMQIDSNSSRHNTGEILTDDGGWKSFSYNLPVSVFGHCMVLLNSTSVIVIGGITVAGISPDTYIFNTESNNWTKGPSLKFPRSFHTCAKIKKDNLSNEFFAIVVGGESGNDLLSSVEILDEKKSKWVEGPNFSVAIGGASMVEDSLGGVIVIGGTNKETVLDSIYHLSDTKSNWTKMAQKLKIPRYIAVAILVPDEITNCEEIN